MLKTKTCGKCGGRMGEGSVLTKDTHGGSHAAEWLEGPLETSIWWGVKTKGKRKLPLAAYRCERCGLVESYAEAT